MADPRSNLFTVKACPPSYSASSDAKIATQTGSQFSALGALNKIGDLQVLNTSAAGTKIGQGLRTLASISNSVRSGCGALPTSIGGAVGAGLNSVDTGARWVLEQTGITQDKLDAVASFSPSIANQAYGQAKTIFQQVKQGHFKVSDIPGYLQDFQNLERLGRNIFTPQSWFDRNKFAKVCEASPYAKDLIRRAPKFKFLFIVQFVFNDGYSDFSSLFGNDFAFVVKKSSRPSVKFDMEDINYYNFRTKLMTKTTFDEMQMSFYDDGTTQNSATQFVTNYMRAISPITNLGPSQTQLVDAENRSMDFGQIAQTTGFSDTTFFANSSSRGSLSNDNATVLKEVILYHVFDYGQLVNVYHFFNPRVTTLTQDDVDMSIGNEANEVQIVFNYDSVYTELSVPMANIESTIVDAQGNATYKIRNVDSQTKAAIPPTYSPDDPVEPASSGCAPSNPLNTSNPPGVGGIISGLTGKASSLISGII